MKTNAALIALDWGSSNLRAYLLDARGEIVATRDDASAGASVLPPGARHFDQALMTLVGDWCSQQPGLSALACGMVGSAHGWREAPYLPCPTDITRLHTQTVEVRTSTEVQVLVVPGLIYAPADGAPDVMRGEETQIAGVLALRPDLTNAARVVLPGTHSKWALVRDGCVTAFATRMTGELFAVLRRHSVLGRLMPAFDADFNASAFEAGLDAARATGGRDLTHELFAVRSLGLTGQWPGAALSDYLSGLLIGHELVAGLADTEESIPLVLAGEAALCARYRYALLRYGRAPVAVLHDTAPAGLWRIASAAGLVEPHEASNE
jgi:2-dehydro-3-deoxygalactonokinase